ncbi:MAG: IclR family acetate operon transcriptional repressor [Ilumatobacter sp.]|jgi:IclR family acetate operon transcriptional repressor
MASKTSTATAPKSGPERDQAGVPRSISRVLDLFEIVLAERNCNLTAAANASKLTPTTALRYLRALEARGYVDRDESGDFSAGPTILRIAASLRGGTVLDRLATIAQPHLDELARRTGESTYLAVSDGRTGTYIATAESPRAIRHVGWVGQDVTLDGSALGAALDEPGITATRTGAVEADITAISRALPSTVKLGFAISIVGPEYRFGTNERTDHEAAIAATVDALAHELRTNGEDYTS